MLLSAAIHSLLKGKWKEAKPVIIFFNAPTRTHKFVHNKIITNLA